MAVIVERFIGKDLTIPEDRLYEIRDGLWAQEIEPGRWAVGLTEPILMVVGGVRDLADLVQDGSEVEAGENVVLALTSKIKYLESPLNGVITFAPELGTLDEQVGATPYDTPIFEVKAAGPPDERLVDAEVYAHHLRNSEGATNPEGHKGPGSATCKSVYWGLGQQKITEE